MADFDQDPTELEMFAELERRLAPLADADDLLAGLDLEGLAARELAKQADAEAMVEAIVPPQPAPSPSLAADDKVVQLRPLEAPAQQSRGAALGWLAAASLLLGLSVAVLLNASPSPSHDNRVEITGSSAATRVILDTPTPAIHEQLRGAHAPLSGCALELAPGSSRVVELRLSAEGHARTSAEAAPCVEAALAELGLAPAEPTTLRVELQGPRAR